MVNFKYWTLPLLVGLLGRRVAGECTFTWDGTNQVEATNPSTDCTTGYENGVYKRVQKSDNYKLIKYTYDAKATTDSEKYKVEDAEAGIYDIEGTKYICPTTTTCTETTTEISEAISEVGYYKISNNYYACYSTTKEGVMASGDGKQLCKKVTPSSDGCTEENIGKLVNKSASSVGLCLAKYEVNDTSETPVLLFSTDENNNNYFVKHVKKVEANADEVVFNFDITFNYYAVKSVYVKDANNGGTDGKIVFDATVTDEDELRCAEASTGKEISRKEDFCGKGTGKYYACDSGRCKSYLQSDYETQESNNEVCIAIETPETPQKYVGNCISGGVYLVDDAYNIINSENSSSAGKIITMAAEGSDYKSSADSVKTLGYYINADVDTKNKNPLIKCNDSDCSFVSSDKISVGYYVSHTTKASVIKCTSNTSCEEVGTGDQYDSCSAGNVGKIKISGATVKICVSDVNSTFKENELTLDNNDEYRLLNVAVNSFPGVTTSGNYVIKMERESKDNVSPEDIAIGTILLVDKESNCEDAGDNEIIKKKDGNLYYCAGGKEIDLVDGASSARFAITIGGSLQVVEMTSIGPKVINANSVYTSYKGNVEGYYVDRTKDSTALVKCTGTKDGDDTVDEYLKCIEETVTMTDTYEVFINKEKNFKGSNGILSANIIVCSSTHCEVPEKIDGKYYYGKYELNAANYFINHQDEKNEVIKCATFDGTCTGDSEPVGNYINGIQDLSIIKCVKNEKDEDDEESEDQYVCQTLSAQQYGYYNSHVEKNYIKCDNEKCKEETVPSNKNLWFINSDSSSKKIIKCIANTKCEEIEAADYYLDSSLGEKNMIYCSGEACTKVEGVNRGVYISDNGKELISCTNAECSVITGSSGQLKSENKEKIFYLNGDASAASPLITVIEKPEETEARRKRTTEYIWGASSAPTQYDVYENANVDKTSASNPFYGIIYCATDSSCIEIKDTPDNSYFMDIVDNEILKCTTGSGCSKDSSKVKAASEVYLVDKSTSKIVTSGSGSLVICSQDTADTSKYDCQYVTSGESYYLDSLTTNNIIVVGSSGEYTTKSASDMVKENGNGYYINSDDTIIACGSTCSKFTTVACAQNLIGKIITSKGLCINYDAQSSSDDKCAYASSGKYMIKPASTTNFPGFEDSSKSMMVLVDDDKIVQVKPDSDVYYLISKEEQTLVTDENEEGDVYKCGSDGKCESVKTSGTTVTEKTDSVFYPNSDSNTSSKGYANIECKKEEDEENSTEQKKAYIMNCYITKKKENEVYCLKSTSAGSLYSCENDCSSVASTSSSCYTITSRAGYYLPYQKNNLIYCTSGTSCSYKSPVVTEGYYKSEDNDNTLIHCKKSVDGIRCEYESSINNGYYIGNDKNLIYCNSSKCVELKHNVGSVTLTGWYKSAETGKVLVRCDSGSCKADSKPAVGYYPNGGSAQSNYQLIYCTRDASMNVSCQEKNPENDGYFIYAEDSTKLIKCTSSECNSSLVNGSNSYYVNGVDKKLIYCITKDESVISCENYEKNGWFRASTTSAIYCSGSCTEKASDEMKKGYYINAGHNSSSKPLLQYGTTISEVAGPSSGWYINAGSSSIDDRIIECDGSTKICSSKAATTTKTNGRFYEEGGEIKLYINNSLEYLITDEDESSKKYRYIYASVSRNLYSWIANESTGFVLFEIHNNKVTQKKIDGYSFDETNNILYKCNGTGSGICTEISNSDIEAGYYINYTDKQLIRCNYDINESKMVCLNIGTAGCDKYNIKIDGSAFKLCKNDEEGITLSTLSDDMVYALGQPTGSGFVQFPKPKNTNKYRYFLATANKYYVKFSKGINEVQSCGDQTKDESETNTKLVCLSNSNKLISVSTGEYVSVKAGDTIQINMSNEKEPIEYDADTNNGYFEYTGTGEVNILKKVYIKEASGNYKLVCEIGDLCIRKEKAPVPILGYQIEKGIMKIKKKDENAVSEVQTKIMPGTYINYDSTKSTGKAKVAINCYEESKGVVTCEEKAIPSGITYENGKLTVKGVAVGDKLFTKLCAVKPTTVNKRSVSSDVFIINELSDVSYNEKSFDGLTNVFLDGNKKRITNDIVTDESAVTGYICESNGECRLIQKSGNIKYLINTIQKDTKENTVAVCGVSKCSFINAKEGLVFENYAAINRSEALIKCSDSGCQVSAPENNGKLPDCDSVELMADQYCIDKNTIKYGINKETDDTDGIKLFDATNRKLTPVNVEENHYGAVLYNCPTKDKCYVTYGYIANTDKSGYSVCDKNGCMYKEIEDLKSSCSEAGEGSLIPGKPIKLCTSDGEKENTKTASTAVYSVKVNSDGNYPESTVGDNLLVGISKKDKEIVIYNIDLSGYVLIDNNRNIVSSVGTKLTGILYECDGKQCKSISNPEYGYYKSSIYSDHITIKSTQIDYESDTSIAMKFGSENNSYYYFQSSPTVGYNYGVIFEATSYKITPLKTDNFVLLNSKTNMLATEKETTEINELYLCNASIGKCSSQLDSKQNIEDGWYISGQEGYDVIKCEKNSCVMVKGVNKVCNGEGDLIFSENEYQICILKDNRMNKYKLSENIGKVSELTSDDDSNIAFPNKKSYIIVGENYVKGIGYRDKENESTNSGIPLCKNAQCVLSTGKQLEKDSYCMYQNKIYTVTTDSGDSTTNVCTEPFSKDIHVELFIGSSRISSTTKVTLYGTQLMYCKNGECNVITGYKKIGSWYKCDYGICEKVTLTNSKVVGEMNTNSKFISSKCESGSCNAVYDNKAVGADTYYYIEGNNEFPGIKGYKSFIVEGGADYAVPFKGNGYYLINYSTSKMLNSDPQDTSSNYAASTTNHLYFCNEYSCAIQIGVAENKFYENAASTNPKQKSIIGCYNGKCDIANDGVIFSSTYSNCDVVGKLVRTTTTSGENTVYGEYSLCYEKNKAPVSISVSDGKSKYYMLTLSRKDTFAGISIKDDEKYDDVKRNIIVEIGDGYVGQYEKEGYVLYNPTNKEIVENVGNTRGTLYYCKKGKTYDGDTIESFNCEAESSINNGWYFNDIYGDNRAIRCADNTCQIVKVKESSNCQYSGSIIYNNRFKICQSSNKQIDIINESKNFDLILNVELLTEFPGMKTNNTDIVLSVEPNKKVYQVKMKNNYVVRSDKIIIEDVGVYGNLYQCYVDGHCDLNLIPKDNYYVKSNKLGKDEELIKCDSRLCKLNKSDSGLEEGFRVSANPNLPIIQCIISGSTVEGKFVASGNGKAICSEKDYKEGWYINSGEDKASKPLIECTKESGCVTKSSQGQGWYINSGAYNLYGQFGDKTYPIIKDDGSGPKYIEETLNRECSKGGEIINPSSNTYKLCKSADKYIEFSKSEFYDIIDNEGTLIAVKSSATKIIIVSDGNFYKDNVMYECGSGSCVSLNKDESNDKYVYDKISSILMKATCSNGNCSWSGVSKEGNYFIDSNKNLVTNKEITGINEIYECTSVNRVVVCSEVLKSNVEGYFFNSFIKDDSDVEKTILYSCTSSTKCETVEYIEDNKDNDRIKKCSELSYKSNYCFISYPNEENREIYSKEEEPIINSGKMCISDSNKYYFALSEINTGIDNPNCIVVPSDSTISYYAVGDRIYKHSKYGTRVISSGESIINGLNNDLIYYNHRNYNLNDVSGIYIIDNDSFISCYNGKCESVSKIMSCTYDYKTEKCSVSSGSINAGQICRSTENKIYLALEKLSSSGGKCINHETSWSYSIGSKSVTPNYGVDDETEYDKPIYQVLSSDSRMYEIDYNNNIRIMGEGIYLIDSAKKMVNINDSVDISKESQFTMYVCTLNGCREKKTCSAAVGSYEYIYDNGKIIQCDPKSNTVKIINSDGYFVNSAYEDLIKCKNGVCIEITKETGMEGYYLDAGNEEKVIRCDRDGVDNFKCISDDAIQCDYDVKTSKCTSRVGKDILRNSYCYYVKKDSKGIIGKPMMLYVEDFIKGKDTGKCIKNENESEVFYYHYRKSKFLGNNERDEIIRYSKGAIVSLYEKDLGYYIITTDTRKGVTSNVDLNKSRLYECTSNGCIEQHEPVDGRIYINKASDEKMIRYHSSSKRWEVMGRHCIKSAENKKQCTLPERVNSGDIIYIYEEGDKQPTFKASWYDLNTLNTLIEENNEDITSDKYQFINSENKMYVFSETKQFFDVVDDKGYYLFKTRSDIPSDVSNYYHNLEPYRSTVNTTHVELVNMYTNTGSWNKGSFSLSEFTPGYYWNKADIKKEGITIQVMDVPDKKKIVEEDNMRKRSVSSSTTVRKFKSIINKCSSSKVNNCATTQEGQIINKGDVCVVFDGENKGLYIAKDTINKNGASNNCYKSSSYLYIGSVIEFAGQPLSNTILNVGENNIQPFTEDSPFGYYVIDKDNKLLSSTTQTDATGYKCGWYYDVIREGEDAGKNDESTKRFECNSVSESSKYFRTVQGDIVYAKSSAKWYKETKRGYFFFNSDSVVASIQKAENEGEKDVVDVVSSMSSNVVKSGTYLNAAVTENRSYIIVGYDSGTASIKTDYKLCNIISGENCRPAENYELSSGDVCYATNKNNILYLVEVTEQNSVKKYSCYTGSEKLKYRYVNGNLKKLDGYSVQDVDNGYYILNSSWEEYTSTYPEVPSYIFSCDSGRCEKVDVLDKKIEVNSDVIINAAASSNSNKLLRYYPTTGKFVNAFVPGYYVVNSNSEVSKDTDTSMNYYYLKSNGVLTSTTVNANNIYINRAKEGTLVRNYAEFENANIKYNSKKDRIQYNNKIVEDSSDERILIKYDGYIYEQKPQSMEVVSEGLYAIKANEPFTETEWTTDVEICYFRSSGSCDTSKLSEIKQNKYTINIATRKPTVLEYNDKTNAWRMVDEDGVYFFFENGYSITSADRRISKVYEVIEGEAVDITDDENRIGFYNFNDMIIESNSNGWEDGVHNVETVIVEEKYMCKAYETDEIINENRLCYNSNSGICIPKLEITSYGEGVANNCVFSEDNTVYYFLVENKLYSISNQAFKIIKKNGLYVVNSNKKVYEEELENKATAYGCNNGECKVETELSTGYYLNMANGGIDEPSILYYNSSSKTWRKTAVDGIYFFNDKGYAVSNDEKVAYAYMIENEGSDVRNIIEDGTNGIYINQSSGEENVVVEYSNEWKNAKHVPGCTISANGVVKSDESMKVGDICLDNKKLVFISGTGAGASGKRKREEYTYQGISADSEEAKFGFDSTNNAMIKLEEGNMVKMDISGYVVIEKKSALPVESESSVEADVYQCSSGECESVDLSAQDATIKQGSYIYNVIAEEYPLLKYDGDSKWSIVNEAGYYFFGSDSKVVKDGVIVTNAVEVEMKDNEEIIQRDISNSNELGFYFNKASDNEIIVNNDEEFWSKGQNLHQCNITEIEEGFNCRTYEDTLDEGDYCYDGERIFLLTDVADTDNAEDANCISGSNEEPLYVSSEKVSKLNGISNNKLVRLTEDSIKVVKPGIYILNVNGTLVDNNGEKGEIETFIWKCDESECSLEENMANDVMFITENLDIYEISTENILQKITEYGLYFFNEEGVACSSAEDKVATIIEISEIDRGSRKREEETGGDTQEGESTNGNETTEKPDEVSVAVTKIALDELSEGTYINNANDKTLAIYKDGEWSIKESECTYNAENQSCSSDNEEMEVGDICLANGVIYIITEVDSENEVNKCVEGNDEVPLYLMKDGDLTMVKKTGVSIVTKDGYYAINASTNEALKSEEPVAAKFIKCKAGSDCVEISPEKSSSYLNRAVTDDNIVVFNEQGDVKKATTIETHCLVKGNVCSAEEGEVKAGDVCVANDSLYLIKEEGVCVMAERFIERYQFVSNKVYKLNEEIVVQVFDGYYFMNGDGRAITDVADYSNVDTVAYMCSKQGDCYLVDPDGLRYYKDYTTEVDGKFRVVKYDPEKKSKRDSEGSSGYEIVTEEGIYKLQDGSYVECEIENNGIASCKNIEEVGAKFTVDDELIVCNMDADREVYCEQAVEAGYYLIDGEDEPMECVVNEEGNGLECSEIKKEGYFIVNGNSLVYDCNEKQEAGISNLMQGLNGLEAETDTISTDYVSEVEEEVVEVNARQEEGVEGDDEQQQNEGGEEGDVVEQPEDGTVPETNVKEPVDVTCNVVECVEGNPINVGGDDGKNLYICKKKVKEVEDEGETNNEENDNTEDDKEPVYEWVPINCESGSFLKEGENEYECEEEREGIKEEFIEKPNQDHTSTEKTEPKTTTTKTTTTATTANEDEKTTTTTTTTSKEEKTTTAKTTTGGDVVKTTTTTATGTKATTTTSTTKATATNTKESGASLRSVPSLTLYIVLFIFAVILQHY